MEIKTINGGICAPKGFKATGIHTGIRQNPEKKDVALIVSEGPCVAVGVYTQNKVKASPLLVTHSHLKAPTAKAIICNSGNANACNADGDEVAEEMCLLVAEKLGVPSSEVLVASTGVIGQPLNITPIKNAIPKLFDNLNDNGSLDAANAIMTTDLTVKEIAVSFEILGKTCHIGGIAKGSGMIHPNMATMLGFITTDINISSNLLQKALSQITSDSFNMVSVDGDTSTNDMVLILANGYAKNDNILTDSVEYLTFYAALEKVCKYLAISIAADGEGATKLLECNVTGAIDTQNAKALAKSVITSSLFKSAMFGADANWGRILCALGYANTDLDPNAVSIGFESDKGAVAVCENGKGLSFDENLAKSVLTTNKVVINISVGSGNFAATAWGCDLTYDYVKINGDYRS